MKNTVLKLMLVVFFGGVVSTGCIVHRGHRTSRSRHEMKSEHHGDHCKHKHRKGKGHAHHDHD